jgi:hypothetical protein
MTRNERIRQSAIAVMQNGLPIGADSIAGRIRTDGFNAGYDTAIDLLRDAAEDAAETPEMKAGIQVAITILRTMKLPARD